MIDQQVIQFSTGRSGSTMIWQVLKELFTDVVKCHEKEMREKYGAYSCPIVITQRDPRDVLISIIKVRHFVNNVESIKTDLNRGILSQYLGEMKTKEQILRHYCTSYDGPILILRYEDFYNDYEHLFNELEQFFSIEIDPQSRSRLEETTSIKTNTARQEKFNTFAQHCQESNIHGDHITFPHPGSHKLVLSDTDQEWLDTQLQDEIQYWNQIWNEHEDTKD